MYLNKWILFFLILFLSPSTVLAQANFIYGDDIKKSIPQEEITAYEALVVEHIRKTKGWEPEEYSLKFKIIFPRVHLASFDVVRYDALLEMKMAKKKKLGFHPIGEVRVYIYTEEMRVLSDFDEFSRIKEEAEEKLAKEKLKE